MLETIRSLEVSKAMQTPIPIENIAFLDLFYYLPEVFQQAAAIRGRPVNTIVASLVVAAVE